MPAFGAMLLLHSYCICVLDRPQGLLSNAFLYITTTAVFGATKRSAVKVGDRARPCTARNVHHLSSKKEVPDGNMVTDMFVAGTGQADCLHSAVGLLVPRFGLLSLAQASCGSQGLPSLRLLSQVTGPAKDIETFARLHARLYLRLATPDGCVKGPQHTCLPGRCPHATAAYGSGLHAQMACPSCLKIGTGEQTMQTAVSLLQQRLNAQPNELLQPPLLPEGAWLAPTFQQRTYPKVSLICTCSKHAAPTDLHAVGSYVQSTRQRGSVPVVLARDASSNTISHGLSKACQGQGSAHKQRRQNRALSGPVPCWPTTPPNQAYIKQGMCTWHASVILSTLDT